MVTIGDLALWTSARRQEITLDQHSLGTFAKVTLESTCDSAQIPRDIGPVLTQHFCRGYLGVYMVRENVLNTNITP